jgi:ABC-type tungstate transport system permease subunit
MIEHSLSFQDHFLLVGPLSNPAQLDNSTDILTVFNKIVALGNADVAVCETDCIDMLFILISVPKVPPADRPAVRFLSRFDKSATNIKDSQLFVTIGQVSYVPPSHHPIPSQPDDDI